MSEEQDGFGLPPDALVDRRTVYRKINVRWYPIDLWSVRPADLIAVVDDPELNPDDVQLWVAVGHPYRMKDGRWTVRVLPASDQHKSLETNR